MPLTLPAIPGVIRSGTVDDQRIDLSVEAGMSTVPVCLEAPFRDWELRPGEMSRFIHLTEHKRIQISSPQPEDNLLIISNSRSAGVARFLLNLRSSAGESTGILHHDIDDWSVELSGRDLLRFKGIDELLEIDSSGRGLVLVVHAGPEFEQTAVSLRYPLLGCAGKDIEYDDGLFEKLHAGRINHVHFGNGLRVECSLKHPHPSGVAGFALDLFNEPDDETIAWFLSLHSALPSVP